MRSSWKAKSVALAVTVICLAAMVPVQRHIDLTRQKMMQSNELPRQLPLAAATSAVLGGFRGIAVDILWIQADSMINDKQFYQLVTYYDIISVLQPNFPTVWEFNAWNMAYNISAEWGRPDEKWDWIRKGINFAEKGLSFNPDSRSLNLYTAFIYFQKVNSDPYFVKRLKEDEGLNHWEEAYKYASRAAALARMQGEGALNERRMAYNALYRHGLYVASLGNLAETKNILDKAEEGATVLLGEYPEDPAIYKLVLDIRAEKAKLDLN